MRALPDLPRDAGDRNRTSPFAFTGNKFEFRAVGSSQAVTWPNTVLNTIVAESLDFLATELEKLAGPSPTTEKLHGAVFSVLPQLITKHKRVIFNGDNYSAAWHAEAEKRGLPHYRDSLAAIPVLADKKNVDLFEKYKVLSRSEVESRAHIFIEKFAKELQIESEAMVLMARQLILPAAIEHQTALALSVSALIGAGIKADDSKAALEAFSTLTSQFRKTLDALDEADNHHVADALEHAKYIKSKITPLMAELRQLGDQLETHVSASRWPLPSYRELLFVK